jgi:hypothetical protein
MHRVVPLAYANLYRTGFSDIPKYALDGLRQQYLGNSANALARADELVRVIKSMRANGVEMIPIKGPVVAQEIYGNLALRHAGDLDLLVGKKTFDLVDRVICNMGYQCVKPGQALTKRQRIQYEFRNNTYEYRNKKLKFSLEIHQRLMRNHLLRHNSFTSLLERSRNLKINDYPVVTLSKVDQLFYLCSHGAAHYWSHLFWLVDIAEIVRNLSGLDWKTITKSAKKQNVQRVLCQGILLAHLLLSSPIPKPVLEIAERDPNVRYLVLEAIKQIQKQNYQKETLKGLANRLNYCFNLSKDPKFKVMIALKILLCPDDWRRPRLTTRRQ